MTNFRTFPKILVGKMCKVEGMLEKMSKFYISLEILHKREVIWFRNA